MGKRGNQGWSTRPKDGSPAGNRGWSTAGRAGRPKGDRPPRKNHTIRATDKEFLLIHRFVHFARDHFDAAEKMVSFLEYKDALGDFLKSDKPAKIFDFPKNKK